MPILVAVAAIVVAPWARAEEFAYVTSAARDSIAVIDTTLDAMIDEIPLSIGDADLGLSPDGTRLYTLNARTETLTVIDSERGRVERRLPVGRVPSRLAISPDGRHAYIAGENVRRVDLETGAVEPLVDDIAFVTDIVPSRDGRRLFIATSFGPGFVSAGLVVVDVATGETVTAGLEFWTRALAVAPDESRIYLVGNRAGRAGARVQILDAETHTLLVDSDLGDGSVITDAVVTGDGDTLYVVLRSWVLVVDARTGRLRGRLQGVAHPHRLALSSDGEVLHVTNPTDDLLYLVDADTGVLRDAVRAGHGPRAAIAAPDDAVRTYVISLDGVYETAATGETARIVPSVADPVGIAVGTTGATLVVAGRVSGNVGVVDVEQRLLTTAIATGGAPIDVDLSADGRTAYAGSFTAPGAIFVVDLDTATLSGVLPAPRGITDIAVLPGDRWLLAASYGTGVVAKIDLSGEEATTLVPTGPANGIGVSADGRRVVVAAEQPDSLRTYETTASGSLSLERVVEVQPSSQPCGVAMRRDGSRAFASEFYGARVLGLELSSGRLTTSPSLATPYVTAACGVALSTDETRLYVANSANQLVSVLDADTLAVRYHLPALPGVSRIAIGCPGGCPSPPPTHTPTATATAPPTPTRGPCRGDCNGDGTVTVSDLVAAVGVALDPELASRCLAGDLDRDGRIVVSELVSAVTSALAGCGGPA